MEEQRQRCVYITAQQKKKLLELIGKNPALISNKVRNGPSYRECQQTWQNIATQCNALAGAKKTWRQWRKTWQDLRCKSKKQNLGVYKYKKRPISRNELTPAEQEVLQFKSEEIPKTESPPKEDNLEFVQLEPDILQNHNYSNDMDYTGSISEPESPPEAKVFTSQRKMGKVKNNSKYKSNSHADCYLDCDMLTNVEERKLQVKEDYLKFKKEYLKQKLKLIKEQTEALKSIARDLSK